MAETHANIRIVSRAVVDEATQDARQKMMKARAEQTRRETEELRLLCNLYDWLNEPDAVTLSAVEFCGGSPQGQR